MKENLLKGTNNFSVRQERIELDKLHSGLYFQCEPNQVRVEQIASDFNWTKLQPLDVSYRDGKYNVVDGQHRLFATRKAFINTNKIITVPCLVRYGFTEAQEMELFVELAKDRRKVKPMEVYKALYGSKNRLVVNMVDTINNIGLIFDFKDYKIKNRITAVETVHKIFSELGEDDFKIYLKLIKNTWNGDSVSLQRDLLCGVFEFFKAYRFDFNEKMFIKKLSQYSPLDIKRDGKSDLNARGFTGYAKAISNRYNKGLKDKNRLNNKW